MPAHYSNFFVHYNHLLKMAGYDEISLRDHEFTTQWLSITPQDAIFDVS